MSAGSWRQSATHLRTVQFRSSKAIVTVGLLQNYPRMRATIALRNVAKAAAEKAASERPAAEKKTRSAPMSADHTLYHAHPTVSPAVLIRIR